MRYIIVTCLFGIIIKNYNSLNCFYFDLNIKTSLKFNIMNAKSLGAYAGLTYISYVTSTILFKFLNEKRKKYNAFTKGDDILKTSNLNGKIIFVTGASAGLGKETTKSLLKKGANVYMCCRNMEKTNKARNEIIEELSSKMDNFDAQNINILQIDLGSLQSIFDFAKKVKKEKINIDYLVNNAGVMANPEYKTTTDGIEWQFGVNHIGLFLYLYIYCLCIK